MPDHSSRLANDGDAKTFWQPASNGATFWQVDLEGRCSLSAVKLVFADGKPAAHSLQISEDGVHWKTPQYQPARQPSGDENNESFPQGSIARFLRAVFAPASGASSIQLAEFTVLGRPL
jgi:hypothetical protein